MLLKNYLRNAAFSVAVLTVLVVRASAQQTVSPDVLQKVLDRLDTLEKQNEALLEEVKQLRQVIKDAQAESSGAQTERLEEEVGVQKQEIKDQAQTKVASSQRFSIDS